MHEFENLLQIDYHYSMSRWITRYCSRQFLFETDDDVIIHPGDTMVHVYERYDKVYT